MKQQTIQRKPGSPIDLIRKNEDWDEIDDLLYRTGCWIWFWMPENYLLERIIGCSDWWYIHRIVDITKEKQFQELNFTLSNEVKE
jgi:hypothetical protein